MKNLHVKTRMNLRKMNQLLINYLEVANSIPDRKLGSMFGVSSSTVRGIVKREYWNLPYAE